MNYRDVLMATLVWLIFMSVVSLALSLVLTTNLISMTLICLSYTAMAVLVDVLRIVFANRAVHAPAKTMRPPVTESFNGVHNNADDKGIAKGVFPAGFDPVGDVVR
jgi:hypothetical protein